MLKSHKNAEQHDAQIAYQQATQTMSKLGYNTIQEMMVDMLIEGEYNKSQGTWTEITDPGDIMTTRAHMNLAQAKFYGLVIVDSTEG